MVGGRPDWEGAPMEPKFPWHPKEPMPRRLERRLGSNNSHSRRQGGADRPPNGTQKDVGVAVGL